MTSRRKAIEIKKLSAHLFWDVDADQLSWNEHKIFIVQRILQYGLLDDWMTLYHQAGLEEIGKIAVQIRDLDNKSLAFISALTNIPISEFSCYNTRQLMPLHWDF